MNFIHNLEGISQVHPRGARARMTEGNELDMLFMGEIWERQTGIKGNEAGECIIADYPKVMEEKDLAPDLTVNNSGS